MDEITMNSGQTSDPRAVGCRCITMNIGAYFHNVFPQLVYQEMVTPDLYTWSLLLVCVAVIGRLSELFNLNIK